MTGCERVLARLQHGPATAAELYRLNVIVHSRISDLRKRGHVIVCDRTEAVGADGYVYRLLDAAAVGGWTPGEAAAASSRPPCYLPTDAAAALAPAAPVMGCSPCLGESRGDDNKPSVATVARPSGRVAPEPGLPVGQLSLLAAA